VSATGLLNATVSIGVAPVLDYTQDVEKSLYKADQALLKAKSAGKNQVVLDAD
jgi:PleD family two-component response regulator